MLLIWMVVLNEDLGLLIAFLVDLIAILGHALLMLNFDLLVSICMKVYL